MRSEKDGIGLLAKLEDFIYQDALSFHQTSEKYGIKW